MGAGGTYSTTEAKTLFSVAQMSRQERGRKAPLHVPMGDQRQCPHHSRSSVYAISIGGPQLTNGLNRELVIGEDGCRPSCHLVSETDLPEQFVWTAC